MATNFPILPPLLLSNSRELLPQPDDWESHLCVTNFWFLDESQSNNWQPPEDLVVSGAEKHACDEDV